MRERIRHLAASGVGYHVLLVLLLGLFIVQPAAAVSGWRAAALSVLNVFVFTAALFAVAENRRVLLFSVILFVPSAALTLFGGLGGEGGQLVEHSFALAYLGLIVVVFLRRIFAHERVTTATLSAAACVYLFLGIGWSFAYRIAATLDPGAFTGLTDSSAELFYFSFVVLTTLGFGDIAPASPLARSLAVVEAVIGQLYLVITVARLVALYGSGGAHLRSRAEIENVTPDA